MRQSVILGIVALLAGGCGWFENPAPEEARVMIQGEAGKTVRLITSTKFVAAVTEMGQTRVVIVESDTVTATLPYNATIRIGGDQRFYAETARLDSDLPTVRMQVFLDGKKEFDEGGPLNMSGQPFRFVYTFNQLVTREVVVI